MYKEFIIIIVILIAILSVDFITQNYSKQAIADLLKELTNLKNHLKSDDLNNEVFLENYESIHTKWTDYNKKLSFYIEHSELEKVNTSFVLCKTLIESNELHLAISELEKAVFLLEHIGDKYAFNLENIF